MAKISALPELVDPDGSETVVVVDGDETKRSALSGLVRGVTVPVLQGRPTLGEMIGRAAITISPQNGATVAGRVLTFADGAGTGSFIVYETEVLEVDRGILPVGTPCRARALFRVSPGFAEAAADPADIWHTRIVRRDTPLGGSENVGDLDTAVSGYVDDLLVRETRFAWQADITHVGGLLQFADVDPDFIGAVSIEPVGLALLVDAVEGSAASAADLVRTIEDRRRSNGYAIRYTIGLTTPGGPVHGYANLAAAGAALAPATVQTRQRLELGATIDPTTIALPDHTDLVGRQQRFARLVYNGPVTLTDETRTDHESIRTRGNSDLAGISAEITNGNYPDHSESAGVDRNWVQRVTSCTFRHHGSEAAFAAGNVSEGVRYTPAGGWGLSSGSSRIVNFSRYTSFRGGGVYFHNAQDQQRPCHVWLGPGHYGGDDAHSPDISISTLASGTDDIAELVGATFTTGYIGYTTSRSHADPLLDLADQADFRIHARACRPFVVGTRGLTGRALRIRALVAGDGLVTTSGTAHDVLISLGQRPGDTIAGEPGRKPATIGVANVAGDNTLGRRLGDCRGTAAKQLVVTIRGANVTVTFDQDMREWTNAAILDTLHPPAPRSPPARPRPACVCPRSHWDFSRSQPSCTPSSRKRSVRGKWHECVHRIRYRGNRLPPRPHGLRHRWGREGLQSRQPAHRQRPRALRMRGRN